MFIIAKGNAIREKVTEDGRKHQVFIFYKKIYIYI